MADFQIRMDNPTRLTEKFSQRWYRKGWIDPQNPETFYDKMNMIVERDYYFRFIEYQKIDDQIPEDPDLSLKWLFHQLYFILIFQNH